MSYIPFIREIKKPSGEVTYMCNFYGTTKCHIHNDGKGACFDCQVNKAILQELFEVEKIMLEEQNGI